MPLAAIGAVLLLLKIFEIDPVTGWSWWWILSPFAAAFVWWVWADTTGWTQRRAIRRMAERKQQRRERDIEALGLNIHSDRRKRAIQRTADAGRKRAAGAQDPKKPG